MHEADIIKNDGKYLYVVNPTNADWDSYYNAFEGNIDAAPRLVYDCSISILLAFLFNTL